MPTITTRDNTEIYYKDWRPRSTGTVDTSRRTTSDRYPLSCSRPGLAVPRSIGGLPASCRKRNRRIARALHGYDPGRFRFLKRMERPVHSQGLRARGLIAPRESSTRRAKGEASTTIVGHQTGGL